MAFKALLGVSKWDAVKYVRSLTDDRGPMPVISDDAYQSYAEVANEEFSRLLPLEFQIGVTWPNPASPLVTVANQQTYILNPSNGFTRPVMNVVGIRYAPSGTINAGNESAFYMFPDPGSLMATDIYQPSSRVIRDLTFGEIAHYGQSFFDLIDDPSGFRALIISPIPTISGIPISVRYTTPHAQTTDPFGNFTFLSIPEAYKRQWGDLLFATILDQENDRLSKFRKLRAGMIEANTNPQGLAALAAQKREDVFLALGGAVSVASRSW